MIKKGEDRERKWAVARANPTDKNGGIEAWRVISYRYLSIEGRFGEDFEHGKELRGGFEEASKSCRLILNLNSTSLTVSPF